MIIYYLNKIYNMAKSRRHSHKGKRHSRRRHSRRHYMRGGATSAATYAAGAVGTVDQQLQNTFGPNPVASTGNALIVNGQAPFMAGAPTAGQLSLIQSAGRRRKGKKGGFLGPVVSQAVVPFALWGLQNKYATKRRGRR